MTRRFGALGALLTAGVATTVWGSPARAQECEIDADCDPGFVCETYSAGSCSSGPCSDDGECPEPMCEEKEYTECVPGPCTSDADCGGSMVCHTSTYTICSGGTPDCAPGEDCTDPPMAPGDCEVVNERQCRPRYEVPCQVAADCGPGFRCVEQVDYMCEPGMRDPADEGDSDGDDGSVRPPACSAQPSGTFRCELEETPCEISSDCAAGLECQDNPSRPTCGGAGMTGDPGSTDGSGPTPTPQAPPADDGDDSPGSNPCAEQPSAPAKVCAPPGYFGDGAPSAPGSGEDDGDADEPDEDTGGEEPPSGPGGEAPQDPDDSEDDENHHGRHRLWSWLARVLSGGGCSVASSTPGDLSWLLAFGALIATRRRRSAG